MALEIERKFLVVNDAWRGQADQGCRLRQAYLGRDPAVRVRIAGEEARLTIKGAGQGIVRPEFEYPIALTDASEMFKLAILPIVEKTRFRVHEADLCWEVDVFEGENIGLVMAEIELSHPDQAFDRPLWLGAEVSGEARYLNVNLAANPYRHWVAS
ncbi:Inorganic triphosphatase [Gammaproteobacteria bacterium]